MRLTYLWLGTITAIAFVGGIVAGQSAKPKYEPTHEQFLELKVKQQDAIIAQIQFNQAQQQVQKSYQELDDAAKAVKKANHWPEDLQFNQQTLAFAEPQSAPQTPPTASPAPATGSKP